MDTNADTAPDNTSPAPKKVVVPKNAAAVSPFAFRSMKGRDKMVAALNEFKPENVDPAQLANVVAYAQAEIAALPEKFNAVEVIIEARANDGSRQANVIIFPKEI